MAGKSEESVQCEVGDHELDSLFWVRHVVAFARGTKVSSVCTLHTCQLPESHAAVVRMEHSLLYIRVRLRVGAYLAVWICLTLGSLTIRGVPRFQGRRQVLCVARRGIGVKAGRTMASSPAMLFMRWWCTYLTL